VRFARSLAPLAACVGHHEGQHDCLMQLAVKRAALDGAAGYFEVKAFEGVGLACSGRPVGRRLRLRATGSVDRRDESPVRVLTPPCFGEVRFERGNARFKSSGCLRGGLFGGEPEPSYEVDLLRIHPVEHGCVHPPSLEVVNRLLEPGPDRPLTLDL
jgi:hypothetical protein